MDCDFDADLKCRTCGYRARKPGTRRTCDAYGPPPEVAVSPWGQGVGAELHKLLDRIGVPAVSDCSCVDFARKMNEWGPAGCRERRAEIVDRLRQRRNVESWHVILATALRTIGTEIGWQLDLLDPLGSLVDLAIQRAESAAAGATTSPPA